MDLKIVSWPRGAAAGVVARTAKIALALMLGCWGRWWDDLHIHGVSATSEFAITGEQPNIERVCQRQEVGVVDRVLVPELPSRRLNSPCHD
ncbi:MAG: hypothetical protein M3P18_20840 [Actinomycetota bacterium]|nr:hypothetical protein [Actinomycetota bacterium]